MDNATKLLSQIRNPFTLLSALMLFLLGIMTYILLNITSLPSSLWLPLLSFIGVLFLICFTSFLILLWRNPTKLFAKDISDLMQKQDHLHEVTSQLTYKLSTAEETLLPIISGKNINSHSRLKNGKLIIGAKSFAEQVILGNILAGWIEKQLLMKCERQIPNGSTFKNFIDLKNGWIDGYVEYTATGCMLLQINPTGHSKEEILTKLDNESKKRFNITWLKPLGFHNNYKIIMRKDIADKLNIESIPDLIGKADRLIFCANLEFINRKDGLVGLKNKYNFEFRHVRVVPFESPSRYNLIEGGEADITTGFETNPQPKNQKLKVLKDPDGFFPDYYAVPVFRLEALNEIKNLKEVMGRLENRISETEMVDMIQEKLMRGSDQAIAKDIADKFVNKLLESEHSSNFT